jgi:hypothetical protein
VLERHRRTIHALSLLSAVGLSFGCKDKGHVGEPEVFTEEDCLATCEQLLPLYSGSDSCTPSCAVNASDAYAGSLAIVTPLGSVALGGSGDVGAVCELVLAGECDASCESLLAFCLSDAQYDPLGAASCLAAHAACVDAEQAAEQASSCEEAYLTGCSDEPETCQCLYQACLDGEDGLSCTICQDAYYGCSDAALAAHDACFAADPTDPSCAETYNATIQDCVCLFQACVAGETGADCLTEDGSSPAMPIQTAPNRFVVSRDLVRTYVANVGHLDRVTGLASTPSGKPKLAYLVEGHPLSKLGLRTGDVLLDVGGVPMDAALEDPSLVAPLFSPSTELVKLRIRRNGVTRTIEYKINP